ncbi:hypothetical protein CLOP_g25048 [Closterium sp. NIES-67]|nr:hypothetical protein CLOP_g25048 [Closterium sp. NIES-67]
MISGFSGHVDRLEGSEGGRNGSAGTGEGDKSAWTRSPEPSAQLRESLKSHVSRLLTHLVTETHEEAQPLEQSREMRQAASLREPEWILQMWQTVLLTGQVLPV